MSADLRIGLALGGGGARGVVHILVCEAFDELGIKPAVIAGTSIGAIVGAGYASGFSGREMREATIAFYAKRREVLGKLWRARPLAFTDLLRGRSLTPQFDSSVILQAFCPGFERLAENFEDLEIPLKIVACDFYGWCDVVLERGPLKPAIAASIAIPALFRPVTLDGRVLIDGGASNPLPFDLVMDADISVACDVTGGPTETPGHVPGLLECVVGAAQISMQSVIREKLKWHHPDVLLRPEMNGFFIMDFLKSEQILAMNPGFKDDLKRRLDFLINTPFELPALSAENAKEVAKKGRGRRLADTGIDLWRMVTGGRGKKADAVLDGAALGVGSAVIEPANAGEGDRRGA
jgi:NTE family protein